MNFLIAIHVNLKYVSTSSYLDNSNKHANTQYIDHVISVYPSLLVLNISQWQMFLLGFAQILIHLDWIQCLLMIWGMWFVETLKKKQHLLFICQT